MFDLTKFKFGTNENPNALSPENWKLSDFDVLQTVGFFKKKNSEKFTFPKNKKSKLSFFPQPPKKCLYYHFLKKSLTDQELVLSEGLGYVDTKKHKNIML